MPRRFAKPLVAVGLIALSVLVRLHALQGTNSDGDVGLYVLVSRAWLHGVLPYTTIWEYKPPGLFAVYALALAIFGDATRAANVLAITAASATSVLLWRLVARTLPNGEIAGILAGTFWACISIENHGLLGDAELLTVPFVTGSLLALCGPPTMYRFAIAGVLSAAAVQMKLTALPFVVLPAALAMRAGGIRAVVTFGCSFLVPAFVETAMYARMHQLLALWDANVGATIRRAESRAGIHPLPRDYWSQVRTFSPAIELAPLAALRPERCVIVFWAWLLIAAATLVAVGEYDLRQFLPLVPPVAALAGIGADTLVRRAGLDVRAVAIAATTAFLLHGYYEVNRLVRSMWLLAVHQESRGRDDELAIILDKTQRLPLDGGVWIIEQTPLLYDMLDRAPPSRYPLTSLLLDRRLWPMLGFEGTREIANVIDLQRPQWIIAKPCGPWADPAVCRTMWSRIRLHYRSVGSLYRNVTLYRRITVDTAARLARPHT